MRRWPRVALCRHFRRATRRFFGGLAGLECSCLGLRVGRPGAGVGSGVELAGISGRGEADPSYHQDKRSQPI
jgi:hypothetical protein